MPVRDSPPADEKALRELEELRMRRAEVTQLIAAAAAAALPRGELTVVVVEVLGADAAIPVGSVQEVVPYAWLAPVLEAPPWVAGVLDLGARMVCVLDVAARLDRRAHRPCAQDFIVVCRGEHRRIGLCVGAVQGVVTFPPGAAVPPPPDVPYAPYLAGTISNAGRSVLLLSVESLLHSSDVPLVPGVSS